MKVFPVLMIWMIGFMGSIMAQTYRGLVLDADSREPLPYANVVVGANNAGTVTNIEGKFQLNVEDVHRDANVIITYLGYKKQTLTLSELASSEVVLLEPAVISLSTFQVPNKKLTPEEILALVEDRFEENHRRVDATQRLFYHQLNSTPISRESLIKAKRSNFPQLTEAMVDTLFAMMPNDFIDYRDVLLTRYSKRGESKILPIEAVSLEEGGQDAVIESIEAKANAFMEDVEASEADEEVYYKIKSGIFGIALDDEEPEDDSMPHEDSLNFPMPSDVVNHSITWLMEDYSDLDRDRMEFITDRRKYNYELEGFVVSGDELAYEISFSPRRRGLYKGRVYVSVETFGIIQFACAFAQGKDDENLQLLGVGHSLTDREARVIFERVDSTYSLKYINVRSNESVSIERTVSILKKKKRFLWDKELNEIKLDVELFFELDNHTELLVMERGPCSDGDYKSISQPEWLMIKRQVAYSPDTWQNRTIVAPTKDLMEFERR